MRTPASVGSLAAPFDAPHRGECASCSRGSDATRNMRSSTWTVEAYCAFAVLGVRMSRNWLSLNEGQSPMLVLTTRVGLVTIDPCPRAHTDCRLLPGAEARAWPTNGAHDAELMLSIRKAFAGFMQLDSERGEDTLRELHDPVNEWQIYRRERIQP